MYIGFELYDYNSLGALAATTENQDNFRNQIEVRFEGLKNYFLDQYTGTLDAEEISSHLFPEEKYDIFLSHSHADREKAIEFAATMKNLGIEVFVDSCAWGYSQDLIDALNENHGNKEIFQDRVNYDYRAATNNINNVNTILLSALKKMIHKCEAFIFLKTENSVPISDYEHNDLTLSPWIYSELQFSALVAQSKKIRLSMEKFEAKASQQIHRNETNNIKFAHKVLNDHLPKVRASDFAYWLTKNSKTGTDALDSLYTSLSIESEYSQRLKLKKTQQNII